MMVATNQTGTTGHTQLAQLVYLAYSNALGVSGGKGAGFLNKTLREGVTEGTQSAVEQTGTTIDTEKGLTVSAKQAVGERHHRRYHSWCI